MFLNELGFDFPNSLIATEPADQSLVKTRVMSVDQGRPSEVDLDQLIARFSEGDLLVINNSQVIKRRVFLEAGLEVLFLREREDRVWEVLMPSRKLRQDEFTLPGGVNARMVQRGRPQLIRVEERLNSSYFDEHGELPLPPYIQKMRDSRVPVDEDASWYQTAWAKEPGSLAAPTASLHFTQEHLERIKQKGVRIAEVTLHVGLGTFLPIVSKDLRHHEMHEEWVTVPKTVWDLVRDTKASGQKVWGLGTTVCRSLESCASGDLEQNSSGDFTGRTKLFITPGFEFQAVDILLTNFHQPGTTLLALVMAFAGIEDVRAAYQWAIERKFRLFSYGDLTVWS